MGVLKHAVLPALAAAHLFQSYIILTAGKEEIPKYYGWPEANSPLSVRESHLLGTILASSLALGVNCVAGIFLENAHFRGMATLIEVIYFACQSFDASMTGFPTSVKLVFAATAGLGLLIHSQEPGIFTKDKQQKKKLQ